jgi:hypothetical protein
MIKDFIDFLLNPNTTYSNFTIFGKIWRAALLLCWLILFQVAIQILFSSISQDKKGQFSEYDDKLLNHVGFIYIVFIGPIIEELIFRLPLAKFNKFYVRISFSFLLASIFSKIIFIITPSLFVNIFLLEMGVVLVIFFCSSKIKFTALEVKWKEQFRFIFWLSILLFSVFHLPYIIGLGLDYVGIFRTFISLSIGAIFICYSRVRYGFFYGVGIHLLYNFLAITV